MDIAALRTKEPLTAWIPVAGNEARILCRYLRPVDMEGLKKRATTLAVTDGEGQSSLDTELFWRLVAEAAIVDFDGLEDAGKKLEPTAENIALLLDNWAEFRFTVMTYPLSLAKMLARRQEEMEKNLSGTSRLESTSQESVARRAAKRKK